MCRWIQGRGFRPVDCEFDVVCIGPGLCFPSRFGNLLVQAEDQVKEGAWIHIQLSGEIRLVYAARTGAMYSAQQWDKRILVAVDLKF